MSDYGEIIQKIVENEKQNFGPVALEHAEKVDGIRISNDGDIEVDGENEKEILLDLVSQYHRIVGCAISAALENEEIEDADLIEQLGEYLET